MAFLMDDNAVGGQLMCGAGQPVALGIGPKKIRGPLLLLLRALLPSLLLLLATRCQRSETDTVNCNKPELLSSTFLTR